MDTVVVTDYKNPLWWMLADVCLCATNLPKLFVCCTKQQGIYCITCFVTASMQQNRQMVQLGASGSVLLSTKSELLHMVQI